MSYRSGNNARCVRLPENRRDISGCVYYVDSGPVDGVGDASRDTQMRLHPLQIFRIARCVVNLSGCRAARAVIRRLGVVLDALRKVLYHIEMLTPNVPVVNAKVVSWGK